MPARNPYLCVVVVVGLIVIALALVGASAYLDASGHSTPRAWDASLGAVIGALSSILVTMPNGRSVQSEPATGSARSETR